MAVLLVIAVTVGATLFFTRDGSGPDRTTTTAVPTNASGVASANDTGPVSIITFEPTCALWRPIQDSLFNAESNGWGGRDASLDRSSWTPQIRAQYDAVGAAMRSAADQLVMLAQQTPHRVMREMYEQLIVYGRAYADSLSSYEPKDDQLALVNVNLHNAIGGVCNAIDKGGIASRAASVSAPPPSNPITVGDINNPLRFVSGPSDTCSAWIRANSATAANLSEWGALDRSVPSSVWPPERRAIEEAAAVTLESYATTMENLGRQQDGTFEDFAALSSLYVRVFAAATPTYVSQDSFAATPGLRLNSAINSACKAAGG